MPVSYSKPSQIAAAAPRTVQVWIEAIADDPEAISAFEVARRSLAAARGLKRLRRMRLIEIAGVRSAGENVREHLHESTQFYNPHKERCHVRWSEQEPPPCDAGERAVLIHERGGERRSAAERWWRHATGESVQVREGVAWLITAESEAVGEALEAGLVTLRDRQHGLLCNPNAQELRGAGAGIPVPWFAAAKSAPKRKRS